MREQLTQSHCQNIPIKESGQEDELSEALGHTDERSRDQLRRVAIQQTTVLLTGETGTGKTRLARLIHELSPRKQAPFLVLDCGALTPSLIESEMFGHVKGAFSGAEYNRSGKFAAVGRGTLVLDEVNSLPLAMQSKLLRAVDERVFEPVGANQVLPLQARLVVISNVPLEQEIAAQRFRSDLYFRLNVVEFRLPTLWERRSVIVRLALRLLSELVHGKRSDIRAITAEALRALELYRWPGNIRELRNVLERAVALSPGPVLRVDDLPETLRIDDDQERHAAPLPVRLRETNEKVEIRCIKHALEKNGNNRVRAAAELGISRMGLYKKLEKYQLK